MHGLNLEYFIPYALTRDITSFDITVH